jgi:hypothetical protein
MHKSVWSQISTWILRILIVIFILSMLLVFFTANLGGRGETQRQALQTMMMQLSGYQVDIQRFGYYQIFPTFTIDAADIVLSSSDMEPDIIIGSVFLQEDVWRRPFSSKTMGTFLVQELITRPGVFGPSSLHIQKAEKEKIDQIEFVNITASYDAIPIKGVIPFYYFNKEHQGTIEIGSFKSNIEYQQNHYSLLLTDSSFRRLKGIGTLSFIPAGGYTLTFDRITGCDPYVFVQIDYKITDNGDYIFPVRIKDKNSNDKKGHIEWKMGKSPHLIMDDQNDTKKIMSCIKE